MQKGLYKMRIKYADATHVSVGYRLDSSSGPFNQGYFDDGETGAGRAILQSVKDRAMSGVAVFIVRYYGGVSLGKRRFEITTMLTIAALSALQYKTLHRRASRSERVLTQDSVASSISSLTGAESVQSLVNETEEDPQQQIGTVAAGTED